ncbi:MAG: hypothetical protein ACI97N_000715, partial [Cognaticolwellia sp.]
LQDKVIFVLQKSCKTLLILSKRKATHVILDIS